MAKIFSLQQKIWKDPNFTRMMKSKKSIEEVEIMITPIVYVIKETI